MKRITVPCYDCDKLLYLNRDGTFRHRKAPRDGHRPNPCIQRGNNLVKTSVEELVASSLIPHGYLIYGIKKGIELAGDVADVINKFRD